MNLKYAIQVLKLTGSYFLRKMKLWLKVFFWHLVISLNESVNKIGIYAIMTITSIDQMNVEVLLQNNTCMYYNASS